MFTWLFGKRSPSNIDWINLRYRIRLRPENLADIRDFALLWNIFEQEVCQQNYRLDTARQAIVQKNFRIGEFGAVLEYFRNRYVDNGGTNHRFLQLHLRNSDDPQLVESVLCGQHHSDQETVLALLSIVSRFRNNLFHGIKDIRQLHLQKENFGQANLFLRTLLSYFP